MAIITWSCLTSVCFVQPVGSAQYHTPHWRCTARAASADEAVQERVAPAQNAQGLQGVWEQCWSPPCNEAGLWQGDNQLRTLGDSQHTSPNPLHPWLAQVLGGSAQHPSLHGPSEVTGDRDKLPCLQAMCNWYRLCPSMKGLGPIPCRPCPPGAGRRHLCQDQVTPHDRLHPAMQAMSPPVVAVPPVTGPGAPCDRPQPPPVQAAPRHDRPRAHPVTGPSPGVQAASPQCRPCPLNDTGRPSSPRGDRPEPPPQAAPLHDRL